MSLGAFLKTERKLRNLTQEDVASAVGIVSPVVSKWENDKSVPDLFALCKICNLLDLGIEEIVAMRRFSDGSTRVLPPEIYNPEAVGKTLRELRIQNGLSQSEAGLKLYVTSQTVSKWEGGAVTLLETLVKLSEFYGVSPSVPILGLEPAESVTVKPPHKSVRIYKRLFYIMSALLVAVLTAASVGGIFVGRYVNRLRGELSELGELSGKDTDSTTPKDYLKLTIHTPDGRTEEYNLKFGETTVIKPEYRSADVVYLFYNEKADGTGKSYPGAEAVYQLFNDLEVFPTYPNVRFMDFNAATDNDERERFVEAERAMSELENKTSM